METGSKIAVALTALGFGYAWLRLPRIKILATNGAAKSVSYRMSINGKTITDTFFLGDEPNLVPAWDSDKHFFLAKGNTETGIVDLSIGISDSSGGYKAVKGLVIGF